MTIVITSFIVYHYLYPMLIIYLKRLNRRKKLTTKGYSIRQVLGIVDEKDVHVESISDRFTSLYQISDAVKAAGLENSNVIIGIDFSASNEWQGRNCFNRKSLHNISKRHKNPYQQVISIIPDVLKPFDEDNLIPVFGFGCSKTKDKSVFPFNEDKSPCKGFLDVLEQYERVRNTVELSGPTSLVPIIEQAIEITIEKGTYHILVIIMDGQVEEDQDLVTQNAIIEASLHSLSIIVVGVGDGPWDKMHDYDDRLPRREFDNFHFVDFHECTRKQCKQPLMNFALHALMEIPDQYKKIKSLGLLRKTPPLKYKKHDHEKCTTVANNSGPKKYEIRHRNHHHNHSNHRHHSNDSKQTVPKIKISCADGEEEGVFV